VTAYSLPSGATSTSSGITLNNGDSLTVHSGGTAIDTIVNTGAFIFVSSGGTLDGTTVNPSGEVFVVLGGRANGTILGSVGFQEISGGTASGTVVNSHGNETVEVGTASGTTVNNGGTQDVYAGGGGLAVGTVVSDGGVQTVFGTASGTTVNSGGFEYVLGTSDDAIVNNSGTIDVSGQVTGTTISTGGYEYISRGGTAAFTVISNGGDEIIDYGGSASDETIENGFQSVYGIATDTTVSGGLQIVFEFGTANSTTINGGFADVEGTTNEATINDTYPGTRPISGGVGGYDGVEVIENGVASNTTVNAGMLGMSDGGSAIDTTVNSDAFEVLSSGGTATDTTLKISAAIDVTYLPYAASGTVTLGPTDFLTVSVGGQTYTQQLSGDYTGEYFHIVDAASLDLIDIAGTLITVNDTPPCFRHGTRLLTDSGELAVDALTIGDRVVTWSGAFAPVVWIGHRYVDCVRHPNPKQVWPIRVALDAFGPGQPCRDLFLSPDHAVFVDGLLVPIRHLINGTTIAQVQVDEVTYYHVELDRHDILLAEGVPAESYLDTGNRGIFENANDPLILHPDLTTDDGETLREALSCAPFAGDEARVKPVWERLAARSLALGQPIPEKAVTDDPAVHLRVDGRTIRPVVSGQHHYAFVVPRGAGLIRLVSRSGHATDQRPWAEDRRRLGVYVNRVVWHDLDGPHDMPVDHPSLSKGWWDIERAGHLLCRWTDGDAMLPPLPTVIFVEIYLAGGMAYRLDTSELDERANSMPPELINPRGERAA
jgi:autotransporter passenger strand-loop-strand repeat protein